MILYGPFWFNVIHTGGLKWALMLHTPVRAWMQEALSCLQTVVHDAFCHHEVSMFPSCVTKGKLKLEENAGSKMERKVKTLPSAWLQLWHGQQLWHHPRILAHNEHFDRLVLMWERDRAGRRQHGAWPHTHTDLKFQKLFCECAGLSNFTSCHGEQHTHNQDWTEMLFCSTSGLSTEVRSQYCSVCYSSLLL